MSTEATTNYTEKRPQALKRRINLSHLPAQRIDAGSRLLGVIVLLLGIFWLIFSTGGLSSENRLVYLISPFAWVGLGIILLGVHLLLWRKVVTLDKEQVTLQSRSLLGKKEWAERLEAYQGVMLRSELRSTGQHGGTYRVYIVELRHPEKKKCVVLFESRKEDDWHASWVEVSRCLLLPALEDAPDGMITHTPEDLTKSIGEKAREGMIEVAFDPQASPPAGLAVQLRDGALEIRIRKKNWLQGGIIGFPVVGVIFIITGALTGGSFFLAPIGILCFLCAAILALWEAITERRVRVEKDGLTFGVKAPWGEMRRRHIPAAQITSIKVGRTTAEEHGKMTVQVLTSEKRLAIGAGLSKEALDWLRDCLVAAISRM